MKLLEGRWVGDNGEPVAYHLLGKEIKKLGDAVTSVFDKDISYERINIVKSLSKKDDNTEKVINLALDDDEIFYKLLNH
jgi:hypothetical protein